jgi:hypothetical protein
MHNVRKPYPFSVVRKEGQGGMPHVAKSTPLGDTRSTENFVCESGQSAIGEREGSGRQKFSDFR